MKKLLLIFIVPLLFITSDAVSFEKNESNPVLASKTISTPILVAKTKKRKKRVRRSRRRRSKVSNASLIKALKLAKSGDYVNASKAFYKISLSRKYKRKHLQTRYMLGLMLYKMNLYQLSAFQFLRIVKKGKTSYLQKSLEKLSIAADRLGDETLLKYAISQVKINEFPKAHRDMLYYRLGEVQRSKKAYKLAAHSLSRVSKASNFYVKAKYLEGLSLAEIQDTKGAVSVFTELLESREGEKVTDPVLVNTKLALARVNYQQKKWADSLDFYRDIPRDTRQWHASLFEASWALLRSGKFRSVLSNFQTLHSSYYENYYQPESLLLRSIVYLYICKYDEMNKVLMIFDKTYKAAYKTIKGFLRARHPYYKVYGYVDEYIKDYKKYGDNLGSRKYKLPTAIINKLVHEGNFIRNNTYIEKLNNEYKKIQEMPSSWQGSAIGRYAKKVLVSRLKRAKRQTGKNLLRSLGQLNVEIIKLIEQEDFIRYEMSNGKKEMLKKKVSGKYVAKDNKEDDANRSYFIQNGYEYWPFDGEYWLDELGNYHYVGTQSCKL